MLLEMGGGTKGRGAPWINIDQCDTADIRHNLNIRPWPIADGSVTEFYSSHCLEHLGNPVAVLMEIARVCVVGAPVEIRVPAPYSDLAMIIGHVHIFAPQAAINMEKHFPETFWTSGEKRLKLDGYKYQSSDRLAKAKMVLPYLTDLDDQVIMEFVPGTAHEVVFSYTVVLNEHRRP